MRRGATLLFCLVLLIGSTQVAHAREAWKERIDRLVAGKSIGVAVRESNRMLYRHSARRRRIPASNQKLLLSMALMARVGPEFTIRTAAAAHPFAGSTIPGDVWVLGRGDPTITNGGRYARALPLAATNLRKLALRIQDAGVTSIRGSVVGNTGYFGRDWWAAGWKSYYPANYIALPTALTFDGNTREGRHIANPELRAARALTRRLESLGIRVRGEPRAGQAPAGLTSLARVESEPLEALLRVTNRLSSNFFAEVLGKRLGVERVGRPGTIAKGAAAITAWAAGHEIVVVSHDSSGLSYENRVSPQGIVRLLDIVEDRRWGATLRFTLPRGGQGTLEDRLADVAVRAKTGTLEGVSALSGWVWLRQRKVWGEFSILSRGLPKSQAADIEDRIVRILARAAG